MKKSRTTIPPKIREQVLKEFNYRCAICGADKLHLHHIDENPSNNDPENLIPLCPNCHLGDQHNPTKKIDPDKLALFRRHKDPTILTPQFHPLFLRLKFLDSVEENVDSNELDKLAIELIEFVKELEMGSFYGKMLSELIRRPTFAGGFVIGDSYSMQSYNQAQREHDQEYRTQLRQVRENVLTLIVELLRYQPWLAKTS
ncbi:HNH endonuclease [Candidatus Leptofilum sp.]|uniref:HNH endonuclease n=1 Tax=Candidatus Leptofilum sp. TaxID=3241576 RepID=UPI003B5C7EF1